MNKKNTHLFLFSLFLVFISVLQSGCEEETEPEFQTDFPNLPSSYMNSSFIQLDNLVYFVGGTDDDLNPLSNVKCLNINSKSLLDKAPLIVPRYSLGLASINNNIFAIGGRESESVIEKYNINLDNWTRLNDIYIIDTLGVGMDGDRNYFTTCNNKIYSVSTNRTSWTLSVFESVDGIDWKVYHSQFAPSQEPAIVSSGNKIYIIGGNYGAFPNSFIEFDTETKSFLIRDSHKILERGYLNICFSYNNKIYKFNPTDNSRTLEVYNVENNSWGQLISPYSFQSLEGYLFSTSEPGKVYLFSIPDISFGFYFNCLTNEFTK